MPSVTAETVKRTLHDLYGYEISDEDAARMVAGAGAMVAGAAHLMTALDLGGVEPPFGYPTLNAEAAGLVAREAKSRTRSR